MAYTWAAAVLLLLAVALTVLRGGAGDLALWVGLAVFVALTVVADSALIRLGVFEYARAPRSGVDVGAAPVEDLAYGCALYLVAAAVWAWPWWRRRWA
jgi:lycopene cyclase domain-containing protein